MIGRRNFDKTRYLPCGIVSRAFAIAIAILFGGHSMGFTQENAIENRNAPPTGFRLQPLTREQAAAVLSKPDDFLLSLSPFDRQSRLKAAADPGSEAFVRAVVADLGDWSDAERAQVETAHRELLKRLAGWKSHWPPEVGCIVNEGRVESNAAYTRQAAIVLPRGNVKAGGPALERLLAHELFHVVSRIDPTLRESLYALIGFQVCPPIDSPASLASARITNPDAPLWDSIIKIHVGEKDRWVTPILFATPAEFQPGGRRGFFDHMTFRLMEVEPDPNKKGHYVTVQVEGRPVLHDPKRVPDYAKAIGENTKYIIHPDEILADNFVHAVFGTPNLPTPKLVERFRETWNNHRQ